MYHDRVPTAALKSITPLQIIRKASFVAAPWKNGGGTTFEALRVPARNAVVHGAGIATADATGNATGNATADATGNAIADATGNATADAIGTAIGAAIGGAIGAAISAAVGDPITNGTGNIAADPFHWRVSIAHIDASGPFSDFAGYDRKMVLLRGAGLTLKFADGAHKSLRRIGDLAEFDGGIGAFCELAAGPCVDLNLMVAKYLHASVRVVQSPQDLKIQASQFESTLIVGIEDGLLLTDEAGATARLEPWDLAVLSEPHTVSACGAVFVALIGTAATTRIDAIINPAAAINH